MKQTPRIGIGVILQKQNKILLGERIGAHGANTWSFPGGHLEWFETPEDCAKRETQEETGMIIADIKSGPWTNDFFEEEQKHYVTLFMIATQFEGEPRVMEPDKCVSWQWFSADDLPIPLFKPIQSLMFETEILL